MCLNASNFLRNLLEFPEIFDLKIFELRGFPFFGFYILVKTLLNFITAQTLYSTTVCFWLFSHFTSELWFIKLSNQMMLSFFSDLEKSLELMFLFQLRVLGTDGSLFEVLLIREHAHYFFSKSKFRSHPITLLNVQSTPDFWVASQPSCSLIGRTNQKQIVYFNHKRAIHACIRVCGLFYSEHVKHMR